MTAARAVEDGAPDAESLKHQLMMRAGVAASLIVLLLGGLAVYERMTRVEPPPPAKPESLSVPAAPAATVVAPPENPLADAILKRDTPPEPEMTSAPEVAPPGQRHADAPLPSRGAPRLVLGGEPPPAPVKAMPESAPPAATVAEAPRLAPAESAQPLAADKGYLVQVGVFGSLDNAEALRQRLEEMGIPAHLESRVVLGPFPSKAAAREAQAHLREAGQNPGLIVPPRR